MAKLICDKKTFDVNKVKPNEHYPIWVFERVWNVAGVEARRLLRDLGLKSKMGLAHGRDSEFFPYKAATELKKLFEEKTDCREATVNAIIKAMGRKNKALKKKATKKTKASSKGNSKSITDNGETVQSGISFALNEAKHLGCDPEEYAHSVERAIASGHFTTV